MELGVQTAAKELATHSIHAVSDASAIMLQFLLTIISICDVIFDIDTHESSA